MVLFAILPLHFAESQQPGPSDQAGANLTAAYKEALADYPHESQETLRKAERAWIDFSNKNEAFIDALQKEGLISDEKDDQFQAAEVNSRALQLRAFFCITGAPYDNPQQMLQLQEAQLTSIYQEFMTQLSGADQELLREAERTWIVYRDLNTNAEASAIHHSNDPQTWITSSRAWVTGARQSELAFILRSKTSSQTTPPADFDDTTEVAEWQKDAKSAIAELMAKRAGPISGPVTDLKDLPSIPEDSASKIHDLWHEMILTLRREAHHDQKKSPVIILSDEGLTIDLLENWSNFEGLFKAGRIAEASDVLTYQFAHKPKVIPPEYASIWDNLTAWKTVIDKAATPFKDHLNKAKASADLGKISDALREYQAAYSIFPDPQIPEEIKKIREQSLGL